MALTAKARMAPLKKGLKGDLGIALGEPVSRAQAKGKGRHDP